MTNYVSPESRKEIDELMEPLKKAETREQRDEARKEINEKVLKDIQSVMRERRN